MVEFEPCLVEEMEAISGLAGKVFPINAPELTTAPYLAYTASLGVNDRTLDGFLESRSISLELNLICPTLSMLKTLEAEVILSLQSFLRRSIGLTAPVFVQDVRYEEPVEMYEPELKMYRCNIEATINL